MEKRGTPEQVLNERGFISVNTAARHLKVSFPEALEYVQSLTNTQQLTVLYSVYSEGKIHITREHQQGAQIFGVAKQASENLFKTEHKSRVSKSPDLVYPPSCIQPFYQEVRNFSNFQKPTPQPTPEPTPILKTQTSEIVTPAKSKVKFSTKENPCSQIVRDSTPHPAKQSKPKTTKSKGFEELFSSDLYTVDEDNVVEKSQPTLKRKAEPPQKPSKKPKTQQETAQTKKENVGYVTPKPEEKIMKKVKVTKTESYVDEKGRIVTEDVEEYEWVPCSNSPKTQVNQGLSNKKGAQTSLSNFILKA